MTDRTDRTEKKAVLTTYCRRLRRMLPVAEHVQCPYCFGKSADVEVGQHERFCDFEPGKDPINFGFPPDSSRNLEP